MGNENYHNGFKSNKNGNGHQNSLDKYWQYDKKSGAEKDDDEIDLKYLLSVVLRFKWSIAGIILLTGSFALWYAFSQQPVYQSTGTMIIAESQNRYSYAGSDIQNLLSSTYGIGVGSTLSNELQVLKSRRLSESIADKIIEKDLMDDGRRFPILWYDYPEDSTVVSRNSVAERVRSRLKIDHVEKDAQLISVTFESYSPLEAQYMVNLTIDTYTELSTEQNRIAANSALNFLGKELDDVSGKLSETEERLREYMDESRLVKIDEQTSAVISRIAALESQKQELQVRKVAIESSIQEYEDQINRIRPGLADQFAESFGPTMDRYQFQLSELTTERLLLLERNPSLRDDPESEPYLVDLNDRIELLKREINKLASELTMDEGREVYLGFLNTTGDGGIAQRLTDLRNRLIELRIEEAQLESQEITIDRRLEEENRFIDNLPDNMITFARLQRDADITEQLYLTISRQHAETALWEQTQFGLGRSLDYGYFPQYPTKPNKRLFLIIGLMLGGLLGMGYAFGREALNRTVDGAEKVRNTGYPLLAVIPDFKPYLKENFENKEMMILRNKNIATSWLTLIDGLSASAESYRRLHNNIIYSHPDQSFKTILITSNKKGEGKSTTAINLAVTLSESGKKILIIDSDLRRPNLHKLIGEKQSPGLMEMVFDNKLENSAIKKTIAPNVYALTSGRIPPNPSSIVQSQILRDKINRFKDEFDHIIIDSAPYGIITDAAPMMQLSDGVVLVARFGMTRMNELNQTIENLNRIRANIIGITLVGYNYESSSDYYYSSHYSFYNNEEYESYADDK